MAPVRLPATPLSVRRSSRRNISSPAVSSPPRVVEKFEVEGVTISAKYEGTLPSPPPSKKRKRAPPLSKAVVQPAEVSAHVPKNAQPLHDPDEAVAAKEDEDGEQSDLTPLPSPSTEAPAKRKAKGKGKRVAKKRKVTADGEEEGAEGPDEGVKVKKPRKPRAPKPEPVYVIPDVERKETTFKGRLGYACLNTILRNKKPAAEAIFCSRTCRIDSIKKNGLEWVKELGRQNVRDLLKLIEWNEANRIRFMRMSSEMFPFASHPIYGYSLEYCADDLKAVGDLAKKYGHRLTTHPGQFTQLGSPKDGVVENAVRDLKYHCEMIDRMGLGKDSVMIIHGGGVYGDKAAALARIKTSFTELLPQNVKDRIVLENDEMCYNAEDLLPLCEELDIPLVFDYHHDWIYPSSIPPAEIIRRAGAIWERRGIRPKQHLSEPRPGAETVMQKRAHADRCQALPPDLPDDVDLMIEAKDKEQAVLHLYRIYGLEPVIHGGPPLPLF
ncbi:UV-endonuclease UvdE [Punctularia strigosozonata HHB-11173 SS5]|uniref:UV-endonuclease UvdE n=1 Tax=Punctularia strigosozonata (strain HHB-11173) TaxID=741275 RepID=UPI00044162A8|nr:UV-endonuclease UvdE [Punctularia strigosozonata HHB-11173 SS5]EIN11289.1 UV-endonuclease UvdE [Punctularia strigosozonata HHB-11173 SS5]